MGKYLAADTGGTFTDVAVFDKESKVLTYGKTLTDYNNLVDGIFRGIDQANVNLAECKVVKHGTTQVINDLLQRDGVRTALVTTKGFRDILEIRRGSRPVAFDLSYDRIKPLIPRSMRFELDERIDAKGMEHTPINRSEVAALAEKLKVLKVEAIAISFLNSYRNDAHESEVQAMLKEMLPDCCVVAGAHLSSEWMEYERTSTAVANAYVCPKIITYISEMEKRLNDAHFTGSFYMMASNGGVLSLDRTISHPVAMVESGPVGGCIGAVAYAKVLNLDNLIAFDMGGTTAKSALIEHQQFGVQSIYYINGYEYGTPIRTPVLDIVEVGTGGGSIAAVDSFGRLSVGPKSAGSEPGPVVYGKGGLEPTVTDANLILGRLSTETFMNGTMDMNMDGARKAIIEKIGLPLGYSGTDEVENVAHGIVRVANTNMTHSIKEISIERGYDIRDCPMFAFGGGGPLHATDLARELNIRTVIIPPYPGIFSAVGMLMAEARIDEIQTYCTPLTEDSVKGAWRVFDEMVQRASGELVIESGTHENIRTDCNMMLKFAGQLHELKIPVDRNHSATQIREAFECAYQRSYGHAEIGAKMEIAALSIAVTAPVLKLDPANLSPKYYKKNPQPVSSRKIYFSPEFGWVETPVYQRSDLGPGFICHGSAVIEELGSTTIVGPDDVMQVGEFGELWIECSKGGERDEK